jgi:hypothetical protein
VQVRAPDAAVPPNLTPAASQVQAGPGAMRAAGQSQPSVVVDRQAIVTEEVSPEDAAQAVDLTPKKTKEEEAVERRWFGG